MGNFEEESYKTEGEIMDSLHSNEKKDGGFSVNAKLTELTVVKGVKEETDVEIEIFENM